MPRLGRSGAALCESAIVLRLSGSERASSEPFAPDTCPCPVAGCLHTHRAMPFGSRGVPVHPETIAKSPASSRAESPDVLPSDPESDRDSPPPLRGDTVPNANQKRQRANRRLSKEGMLGRRTASPDVDRQTRKRMIEEDSGPSGVLVFKLHSAKNLKAADSNGKSDPYVLVRVPGTRCNDWRSRTLRKTIDPTWNQEHDFPGYLADIVSQPLEIKVYDFDVLSFNDPIGSLSIPLWELMRQRHSIKRDNETENADGHGRNRVAQLHFTDVPLEGVDTGTISFSVSFELKFVVGLLPGTPVHASAAQALRRPPPPDASTLEKARDRLLLFLGHPIFLVFAIVWVLALVGWGAFAALSFGALYLPIIIVSLTGGDTDSVVDGAQPYIGLSDARLEMWANLCVQVLTALFTYFNILTLPWRVSILYHLCGRRSDAPGRDFYGRPTEAIWFSIPRRDRAAITYLLLASTVSHIATQASRFAYPSFAASNELPGVIVCNVTFAGAVVCGAIAGILQGIQEGALVKSNPDRYPPSLLTHIHQLRKRGEFSCLALLCCKLGRSLEMETHRWHAEKEIARLRDTFSARRSSASAEGASRGSTPAADRASFKNRNSFLSPRGRAPASDAPEAMDEERAGPTAPSASGKVWWDDEPKAKGARHAKMDGIAASTVPTCAELEVIHGQYTTGVHAGPGGGPMPVDLIGVARMHRHPEGCEATDATIDGGLTMLAPARLPPLVPVNAPEHALHAPIATRAAGGLSFVPVAPGGLRGAPGKRLQQEYEFRRAEREHLLRLQLSARERQLHVQIGETYRLQEELARLRSAAAHPPTAAPMARRLPPLLPVLPAEASNESERTVTVKFDAGEPLGLSLTTDEHGRATVTNVVAGSAAERHGCVAGSEIVEVDGIRMVGMNRDEVLSLLTSLTMAPSRQLANTRTLTLLPPASTNNEPPLPDGWQAATAPSGLAYYIHVATQTTQWTRPDAEEQPIESEPLPAGWTEAKAPDGRPYYFSGQETRWSRPTLPASL